MTCTVCFPRNWRQITYVTLVQIHVRYCWIYLWPSSSDPLIEILGSDWTITPVWPLTPLKNTHWGRLILNCKTHLRVGERRFFLLFDMFLPCKFAFYLWKKNGGVSSYFFCYRVLSERVRFLLFYEQEKTMTRLWFPIVTTIGENPFVWVVLRSLIRKYMAMYRT